MGDKIKKQLLLILLLILQSFAMFIPASGSDWVIDGDTVYFDDENVYLSATPHTIMQDTWVTFQVRSKGYEGDIDAVWLFNTTNCKPTKPVYYKVGDGDWNELTKEFTIQTIDFENMTKAYLLKNVNIQSNTDYYLKCFVDIKFNTQGKYWWGVKPSALGWNKGYYLDPWWHSSWNYYRLLTISNTFIGADLTNFPVLVNISAAISTKCDDGKSIRFVNIDNTTEYYHQFDGTWDSGSYNLVWVNITSVSSSSPTKFLMYYNNTDAGSASTDAVWNSDYLAVYHLTNLTDSTSNGYDLTATNSPTATATGKIGDCYDFEFDDSEYANNTDFYDISSMSGCTIEFWGNADSNKEGGVYLGEGIYEQYNALALRSRSDHKFDAEVNSADGDLLAARTDPNYITTGVWRYLVGTYTDDNVYCYVNWITESAHNNITEGNANVSDVDVDQIHVGRDGDSAKYYDGLIDEIRISKVVRNASWLSATYNSTKQTASFLTWGAEGEYPGIVRINETTGIELTNATLNGYLDTSVDLSGNYNCGFWIGRTTPVTATNIDQNVTCSYTITESENFSYNVSSLSKGTHYYVKAWIKNSTYWWNTSDEDDFYTKCDAPTGLTATLSGCNVNLAWTKGSGAVNTVVIRRADAYPTWPTNGTEVYNGTDSSYSDTTGGGSHQYYRIWSWTGDKLSDGNATDNEIVPPCPPTGVTGEILVNSTLKISWTKGTGANTTLVVRTADSTPSSRTDGTVIFNSTGLYVVETDLTQNYYYRLWSYANNTYSSSVDVNFGALVVSCYDEETNGSLYFDVFVSNQSGSQTYESKNNTNPLIINVGDNLPIDDKVSIRVSAASNYSDKTEIFTGYSLAENATITYIILLQEPENKAFTNVTCINTSSDHHSYPAFTLADDVITILANAADEFNKIIVNYTHYEYESRTYYRDLTTNHIYVLNAYLPSADDKILCRITIIDEYSQSVDDAYVEIKRNVNGSWVTIASRYTDGNGQVDVFLVDSILYKFVISKTGFETEYADWTPSADAPTHTFKIAYEETEIPSEVEPEFTAERLGTTIYVNYTDSMEETINSTIYIYNINYTTGNSTLVVTISNTSENTIQYTLFGTDTNCDYRILLYYNHTTFGSKTVLRIIRRIITTYTTPGRLNVLLTAIIGQCGPFLWTNGIMFLFFIAMMFQADKKDAGKCLMLVGGICIFINVYIGFDTALETAAAGSIPALFIIVGIILEWINSRRNK